jgi:LAS superfamily LD-carboxypeptidase LdcB
MPSRRSTFSRRVTAGTVALLVLLGVAVTGATAAEESDDPAEEREQVREDLAAATDDLDALRATDEEVTAALAALEDDVRTQQARLEDAQHEADLAQAEADRARNDEAEAEAAQGEVEVRLSDLAVDSYVGAGSTDPIFELLASENIDEGFRRQALTDIAAGNEADLIDEMAALEEDAAIARESADAASEQAAEAQTEAEQRVAEVQAATERQQAFATQVDERIEARLAEASILQDQDAELSAEIAAQQAAVAAANGGGGSGGSFISGNISLTTVRGITVASSIAGQLEGMLSAASSAGINLSGGGYRDPSAQIAVRRNNCGTSNYAIYEMPASACSPPTARPGASQHERGLAIDFSANGSLIESRSSAGFQWLAGNASRYGFYNLPSEPWHWSTTGG